MKHYYSKCIAAIIIIISASLFSIRLAYPGGSGTSSNKETKALINELYTGKVHISPELIDNREYNVSDISVTNQLDAPSLARQFLGKGFKKDSDTQYSSSDGTLSILGTHFTYTPVSPKFSADTKSISLSNATDITKRLCDEYGIDYRGGRIELSGSENGISVAVMKSCDGLPVFNNSLIMQLNNDGLHSITGVDFNTNIGGEKRAAKSISDALKEFTDTCTDKKRETIVTDVRLGYILTDTEISETHLKPVWRIIVENSSVYYIDA